MINKGKGKRRKIVFKPIYDKCPFCVNNTTPDYKKYEDLVGFLTDRARIYPSSRSGVCSKHQRALSSAVKRARHLALLPFVEKV